MRCRKQNGDGRSDADFALDGNTTVHDLDQIHGDGKAEAGAALRISPFDGFKRIGAYRRLKNYALAVEVLFSYSEILAPAQAQRRINIQLGGALTVFLVFFGAAIGLSMWRQAAHGNRLADALARLDLTASRYRQAERIARIGHWSWTPDPGGAWEDGRYDHSEAAADIFGVSSADMQVTTHEFLDRFVHPGDRAAAARIFATMADASSPDYTMDYRIIRPDGTVRHMHEIAEHQKNSKGGMLRTIGTLQDVTEFRKTETALRENEAHYRQAEKLAQLGHWRWKAPVGHVTSDFFEVSPAAAAIHGVSPDELIRLGGQWVERFVHPEDREAVRRVITAPPPEDFSAFVMEYRIVRSDGSTATIRENGRYVWHAEEGHHHGFATIQDITEQRRTEAALRESEERYQEAQFIARMGHWSWTPDPGGGWEGGQFEISKAAADIYGVSPADMRTTNREFLDRFVHPGDRAAAARTFATMADASSPGYTLNYRTVRPDGAVRHIHEIARHQRDWDGRVLRTIGTLQDMTELRESETNLATAQRIGGMGSWEWNIASGRVRRSAQLCRILGLPPNIKEFDYANSLSVIHPDDAAYVAAARRLAVEEGAPYDLDYRIARPNGEVLVVHSQGEVARDGDGRAIRMTGIIQDVTERRRLESELRAAMEEAQAANRAKSLFLANMSHELRTPLNAIIGFAEIMREEMLGPVGTPAYKEYSADINSSGLHLLKIINDLLDISQIEVGQMVLHEDVVEVPGLIEACMRMVRPQADGKEIELTTRDGPNPRAVMGDERLVRQILLNLLANAVKFTPAGGNIEIAASLSPMGAAEITVTDTGIGMPRDKIALAFKPFVQLEDGMTRKYEGTGLGLSIAKAFAELHGGELVADSEPGRGTTVTLRLPAARVVGPDPDRPPAYPTSA